MSDIRREIAERLSVELADQGKLIEAGWVMLRALSVAPDASATQVDEMRNSFFAGAQHLFASIMTILEAGEDVTDNDLRRMDLIQKELDRFIREHAMRHLTTSGTA